TAHRSTMAATAITSPMNFDILINRVHRTVFERSGQVGDITRTYDIKVRDIATGDCLAPHRTAMREHADRRLNGLSACSRTAVLCVHCTSRQLCTFKAFWNPPISAS